MAHPAPSQRQLILQALLDRVTRVRRVNGFWTDAGDQVFLGEAPALGPDDPPLAIALVVGDEEPGWAVPGKAVQIRLPVKVVALAMADLDLARLAAEWRADRVWMVIELLLADITRAVETESRTLGDLVQWPLELGPVETLAREPGSTTVGAAANYRVVIKRGWGTP